MKVNKKWFKKAFKRCSFALTFHYLLIYFCHYFLHSSCIVWGDSLGTPCTSNGQKTLQEFTRNIRRQVWWICLILFFCLDKGNSTKGMSCQSVCLNLRQGTLPYKTDTWLCKAPIFNVRDIQWGKTYKKRDLRVRSGIFFLNGGSFSDKISKEKVFLHRFGWKFVKEKIFYEQICHFCSKFQKYGVFGGQFLNFWSETQKKQQQQQQNKTTKKNKQTNLGGLLVMSKLKRGILRALYSYLWIWECPHPSGHN